jgi:hypothetical protein
MGNRWKQLRNLRGVRSASVGIQQRIAKLDSRFVLYRWRSVLFLPRRLALATIKHSQVG